MDWSELRAVDASLGVLQGSIHFNEVDDVLVLSKFDTHGSVHRRLRNRNTNKMQLYYSEVD